MLNKNKSNKVKYIIEYITKFIFFISAMLAVISLLLIISFVFYKGLSPFIKEGYSFKDFLLGTKWVPSSEQFGIAPMIVASILATLGALIIGIPIGILTAVFIAEIAPKKIGKVISTAVELLAGIPSVLYGVFGLAIIVPWIQNTFNQSKGTKFVSSNNSISSNDASNNSNSFRNCNKSCT